MTTLPAQSERTFQESGTAPQTHRDSVLFLSFYLVLRIVLPSQYVIGPLGGAGQPAQLVGLGIALWWLTDRVGQPWPAFRVRQPLKRFAFAFLIAVLVSYLVAAIRPLSSAEQLAADRSVLNVIAWTGVLLAAMDGITTRERLDTLLRRVTLLAGLEGALGIVQLLEKQSFLQYFSLPGLANTGVDPLLLSRGSFLRPVGTAISPIEYGIFLSMVLPVALHYALSDVGRRSFLARWPPVAAIGCALSLSLSRSAIVSTVVALALFLPSWPPRLRRRLYLVAVAAVGAASLALHGFLGTILNLFSGIGTDASTASRVDSYSVAWSFITRAPVFGRGTGTFLPEYWILDNQFLGSLIELGVVGLICLLLLFLNGVVTSWRIPELEMGGGGPPEALRLGPVLAAAIAAGCSGFAFFDAFTFPMVPSMVFLLLGCAGALQRLTVEDTEKHAGASPARRAAGITLWSLAGTFRRLWPLAMVGVIVTFAGAYAAVAVPGVYYEQASVVFIAPDGTGLQPGADALVATAGVIASQLGEQGPLPLSIDVTIVGAGIRNGVWVRLPNDGGQWATNFDQEVLDVEAVSGSEARVQAEMAATIAKIKTLLRQDQLSAAVRPAQLITTVLSPVSPPVSYLRGSSPRAGVTALALGLIATLTILVLVDSWWLRGRTLGARTHHGQR